MNSMTAFEARFRTGSEPDIDRAVQKAILYTDEQINYAIRHGQTECAYHRAVFIGEHYVNVERQVKEHYIRLGYRFKPAGWLAGTWQMTEHICW